MKILTATEHTQGHRDNDYAHCVEGELVHVTLHCATARDDPDGECGCGRAFVGLCSRRPTTTAMVRDVEDVTRTTYAAAIRSTMESAFGPQVMREVGDGGVHEEVDELLRLAEDFPVGTVLERRLDRIIVRTRVGP